MQESRRTTRKISCVDCTLNRAKGGAIAGKAVDISDGGMHVCTNRPLAIDEVLSFDFVLEGGREEHGVARVVRQTGYDTYALRFEHAA